MKTFYCQVFIEYMTLEEKAIIFDYILIIGRRVTVHTALSREVFWHEYAKIPRHTSQNSIAEGNLE